MVTDVTLMTQICSNSLSVCLQPFVTKLGIVVHHHELECRAKKWGSIFKVTVWAYIIKIRQFLLYLLLVLNQ